MLKLSDSSQSPPPFTPYNPQQFAVAGDIVSHDPHLNEDGEALYRFLLDKSQIPPVFHLHLIGTHTEHRTRFVPSTDSEGNPSTIQESYTETVTDFDFAIDLSPYIRSPVVQYTVPDDQPAYRGRMYKEIDEHNPFSGRSIRRVATREERKAHRRLAQAASDNGRPVWALSEPLVPSLQSRKFLRQWADEYCASDVFLKEFQYVKTLYGIPRAEILSAVRDFILGPHVRYYGTLNVCFESHADKIYVRPDNSLSRILSNGCLKFLLIIFCIYPFIWLWKRLSGHGGGLWSIAGGAWEISNTDVREGILIEPESTSGSSSLPPPAYDEFPSPSSSPAFNTNAFLARWQPVILRAVRERYQSSTPIRE